MKPEKVKKSELIAKLQRRVFDVEAQLPCSYRAFARALDDATQDKLKASGVVISITVLGGRQVGSPVMIADGLSAETIAALRADVARSFAQATIPAPKCVP